MITPFIAEHLINMELRPAEAARLQADPQAIARVHSLAQFGIGGTLILDEKVIAVFGYFEKWPGIYDIWAFPSIHVEQYAVVYLKTVKRHIRALLETHPVKRLETTSPDDEQHNAWMRFLGFECETPNGMKHYSVLGETYNMWSLIPKDQA